MRPLTRSCLLLALLSTLASCDAPGATVFVDVRTDFLPGTEFVAVETTLGDHVEAIPATGRDDYLEGVRVAELRGVPLGRHDVLITLRDPAGDVFYAEPVILTLEGDYVLRVVISRDCAGVTCPTDQKCSGGLCVSEECHVDDPSCGDPVCDRAADCTASVVSCATPVCTGVACLWELRDDLCAAGERCDGLLGCMSETPVDAGAEDAGPGDAGTDAGSDAGPGVCTLRSDCPADVFPTFGSCVVRAGDPPCAGDGFEQRTIARWQCASRTCVMMEEIEERPCTYDATGGFCAPSRDRECSQCAGGACVPVADLTRCDIGGANFGACHSGICCYGCWDGAACRNFAAMTDTQCGRSGLACMSCAAMRETCVSTLEGGRCAP